MACFCWRRDVNNGDKQGQLQQVYRISFINSTPPKSNMTLENVPFEDVFPIENGDSTRSFVSELRGFVYHAEIFRGKFCPLATIFWSDGCGVGAVLGIDI